jgi:hypothetical protein
MFYTTEEAEKDIVSFDQALELCSIGFDKSTFCHYTIETRQLCLSSLDEDGLYMPDKDIAAPTKSQVFRWFREKYELVPLIDIGVHEFSFKIFKNGKSITPLKDYLDFNRMYEEAENACINQLIEIAKQQDNE